MNSQIYRNSFRILACVPFLVGAAATAFGAPILGKDHEQTVAEPPATPIVPATGAGVDAAVIHFSVLPSPANPNRFETTIVVQQDGGRQICVNHTSPVIVVRSYQADTDAFEPDIPAPIQGQESDDVGELAGFNNKKLFIRPRATDDRFDLPDERFSVGQFEGNFQPDDAECDQELSEGDFACLDEVIRTTNCNLALHENLVRDLRVMIALNSTQTISPAAGPFGNDFSSGSTLPPSSGSTGAAPSFSGSFGGSGGGGLILVPDLIGLPVSNALSIAKSVGLVAGNVTQKTSTASIFRGLIIGTAHANSSSCVVIDQSPSAGISVSVGTPINLVCLTSIAAASVPEPASSALFIVGLLAAIGMFFLLRRRKRGSISQT